MSKAMIIPVVLSPAPGSRPSGLSCVTHSRTLPCVDIPQSPLQEAVLRCRDALFDPRPVVVGAYADRLRIAQELGDVEVEADIVLETGAQSSCAAIVAGCLQALSRDPEAIVLVLAGDQFIPDARSLTTVVGYASWDADLGFLVTFGLKPEYAATDQGYIARGYEPYGVSYRVHRFLENPDAVTAARCVEDGWLWNSRHYLFRATTYLNDLRRLAPEILSPVTEAFSAAKREAPFLLMDCSMTDRVPSLAVETAVMERTARAAVVPVNWRRQSLAHMVAANDTGIVDRSASPHELSPHGANRNLALTEGQDVTRGRS